MLETEVQDLTKKIPKKKMFKEVKNNSTSSENDKVF